MALLVLDAGVLIAHERGDRTAGAWPADRAGKLLAWVGSLNTLDALLVASAQRHGGVVLPMASET